MQYDVAKSVPKITFNTAQNQLMCSHLSELKRKLENIRIQMILLM